jgi:hypothetical protein
MHFGQGIQQSGEIHGHPKSAGSGLHLCTGTTGVVSVVSGILQSLPHLGAGGHVLRPRDQWQASGHLHGQPETPPGRGSNIICTDPLPWSAE